MTQGVKIFLLLALQGLCFVQGQGNTTMCFYCQEDDVICLDPVNIAALPSHRCADLGVGSPRSLTEDEGPPKTFETILQNIYQNDVSERSMNRNVTFQCLKLAVSWSNNSGIYRGCVPMAADERTCEFLNEELSDYNVTSCRACIGDNCNGSSTLQLPLFAGLLLTILVGYLLK